MGKDDFSYSLRECVANMLRVVRGAGKPQDTLRQTQEVINKAVKYREAYGHLPSSELIQAELALYDDYERQLERDARGEMSETLRNALKEDRQFDRLNALHVIHRGALQVAASGLIGQDTQQRAGETEVHQGITMWHRWLNERDRRLKEATQPSRAESKKPARGAPVASSQPVQAQVQRSRKRGPFDQEDLKELRKAIKENDKKKIAELMSKIGPSQAER